MPRRIQNSPDARRPDPSQRTFLFDRDEKLALLRAALERLPSLSRSQRHKLAHLLAQPEIFARQFGSPARIDVLAGRMGASRRTIQRLLRHAETLELVKSDWRSHRCTDGPSRFGIDWENVRRLADSEQDPAECPENCHPPDIGMTKNCHPSQTGDDKLTPLESSNNLISFSAAKRELKNPPPSNLSSSPGRRPHTAGNEEEEGGGNFFIREEDEAAWRRLVKHCQQLGMNAAPEPALDAARQSGATPIEVKRLCDHWLANKPRWGIGALYRRIQNARAGQQPDDPATWPKPSKEFEEMRRRESRRAAQIERQAIDDAARHEAERERRESEELEAACGPLLDQMPADELDRFARATLAGNAFLEKLYRTKGVESGLVRETLLAALASTHHSPLTTHHHG